MKPCTYRTVLDETYAQCDNYEDIIHSGPMTLEICETCPYAKEPGPPGDFFQQTLDLLIRKQRTGAYFANPKGCGSCPEVKRRKPDEAFDLQFVWPYWHRGAQGDEIRLSVRSVEKFFDGRAKCTIVGDKPPWYIGHYIPKRRVPKTDNLRRYRDMLSKMQMIATHPEIDSDFIWMMDDIYFIKPFAIEQMQVPRAERWVMSEFNTWQQLKLASMEALTKQGFPNHDYATHMPHYVQKDNLAQLFGMYDLDNPANVFLWELLYGNTFNGREVPARTRPFFTCIGAQLPQEQIEAATLKSTVLNHLAGGWCEGMRSYLLSLLPDMATIEIDVSPEALVAAKPRKREVKRRPLETHRAYIEAHANDNAIHNDNPISVQ